MASRAGGGGNTHVRQLFFEAVFATRIFQDGVDMIENRWKGAMGNMRAAQAATAVAYTNSMNEIEAKASEAFDRQTAAAYATRDGAIKSFKEQTAAYAVELDKQVAAANAARDKKLAALAGSGGMQGALFGGGQGTLIGGGTAEVDAANATRDAEVLAAQQAMDAKITDSSKALVAAQSAYTQETMAAQAVRDKTIMLADEKLGANMSNLSVLTNSLKGVGNAAMSILPGVAVATGVLGGLYMMADHLVVKYMDYAAATARLSQATGVDVEVMQELILRGNEFGVTAQKMETFLTRFARATVTNSQAFQAMGIDTTNTTTAIKGLMDVLSKTTDDAQKLVIVTSLMPGSAKNAIGDVVAMLSETSAQFDKQIELGKSMGIILDKNAISAGTFGKAIHDVMLQNLQGVENLLAQGLMPNMEAIWVIISSGLSATKGGFESLGSIIGSVLGSIIGFLSGIFGLTIDWNKAMKDATTTMQEQAQAQESKNKQDALSAKLQETNKQQVKDLTEANKDLQRAQQEQSRAENEALQDFTRGINAQTTAIDQQIKVIQDNQTNFVAAEDAKVKALQDEKTNFEDLNRLQNDLYQSQLAHDQAALDSLQDVTARRMHSGESLLDYQRRLNELDLQDKIKADQNKTATYVDTLTQQIDLLKQQTDQQKLDYKTQADAQIDSLNKQKDALNAYLKSRTDAMQSQMQAEQDATTRMVDANTTKIEALQTTNEQAAQASAGAYSIDFAEMTKLVQKSLTEMQNSATGTANNIGGAINAIFTGREMTPEQKKSWDALGNELGQAIWGGITLGFKAGMSASGGISGLLSGDSLGQIAMGLIPGGSNLMQGLDWLGGKMPWNHNADGGIITSPTMSMLGEGSRPEVVIPLTNPARAQQLMRETGLSGAGGGSTTLVANFNGPVADALVAGRVMDRFAAQARRNNLIYSAGL